jgi:squalene-hopene/tetraprenyl-beta-curcumene cyclase
MHVSDLTPQEIRLLEETTRRVESYADHQPLYDHSQSKITESRGTEAVLNALILANADVGQSRREPSAPTQQALKRLWETQRPDGSWDWLDFGLEPFETIDGVYYGATLAALTIGSVPGSFTSRAAETRAGVEKLRGYLKEKYASQSLFNRVWLLLASTRLKDLLTSAQRSALIAEIQGRQRDDGGWALDSLGTWRWSKTSAPFRAPGPPEAAVLAKSDGYGTGLIVYALRQAGLPPGQPAVSRGLQWLRANQQDVQVGQHSWPAWRAYSLNFDREHGGDKGEPWRRMFMSDSATAFAALALVASD